MDNPDDDRTIINVKGVRKTAWNAAARAASLSKDTYGQWLSDAIDLRLRYDAGTVKPPGEAGEATMTTEQLTARIAALAELAKGIAALKAAGARSVGIATLSRGLTSLLADLPRQAPLIRGQERRRLGQEPVKPMIEVLEGNLHE